MSITTSAYGSWRSPISSKIVSESSVKFQEVHVDSSVENPENHDTVYWGELRFDEGGRIVVCSRKVGEDSNISWTPKDFNARTRVHEYGGGAIFVHNKTVYFSNFKDQQMYSQSAPDATPELVTTGDKNWRYADGSFNAKAHKIYCVREDHSVVENKTAKEPVNTVVSIDPVTKQQTILAEGADFYSGPRVSPDGKRIAWVQWNHPNMPWDSTELWTADLSDTGDSVSNAKQIVSGTDISVMLPSWTPYNELMYVGDQTEWWNLYHVKTNGDHVNLLPRDKETGGPHWVFGFYAYAVDPAGSGKVVLNSGSEIGVLNMLTKEYHKLETGFTSHTCINLTSDGHAYCVAGSPTKFECVIRISLDTKEVTVLQESKKLDLDTGYYSIPEEISWKTTNDDICYGYYYPPKNKDFVAPEGTNPPLLIQVHGGPTSQTSNVLSLKKQYFTSRGFAVLDVNYRGSTGYGKTYRHKLRGQWGVSDIDDCCYGAKHLADTGKADPNKLCIDGGSAGGYTTLACLTFRDVFKAGASHYGIGDLEALAGDTHKFESRYLDSVIAPYSGEGIKIYKERSPIHYVDKLKVPIALFQGDEDKIVLPNQAEMMYKAVKDKGIPTMFVLFKDMPKNQPTPRTTPYNKVNFTAEGGFDTKNRRTGKARADAYFTRGNNIISRSKELHTITGAEIKVIIIPTWTGGKPKVWQSNDFPDLQEVTVDPTLNEENAETVEMAAVGTAPSPRKEPLSEIQATNIPSTSASTSASKSKNRCAICHIVYGSEADIESLWVQCSKNGCSWWVHCRCICIQYPATDAGHRALKKWSFNKVFCPKHIQ